MGLSHDDGPSFTAHHQGAGGTFLFKFKELRKKVPIVLIPFLASSSFPWIMSRYLGLSGQNGKTQSWINATTAVNPNKYGQPF